MPRTQKKLRYITHCTSKRISKSVVSALAACIVENNLCATEEETAAFLATDEGKRMQALINAERERRKHEK